MNKKSKNDAIAVIVPVGSVIVGLAVYYSLGAMLSDQFGDQVAGSAILMYGLITIVLCIWSAKQLRGVVKMLPLLCMLLLMLLSAFGAFVISF